MKKLWLVLGCLAFTACGNTPKNPVLDSIPSPQRGESFEEFKSRCNRDEYGYGRGILNPAENLCRKAVAMQTYAGANGEDYVQEKAVVDSTLRAGLARGFMLSGTFVGNAREPELIVNGVIVARGNLPNPIIVDRAGDVRLRIYQGTYRSLNYGVDICTAQGQSTVPCQVF